MSDEFLLQYLMRPAVAIITASIIVITISAAILIVRDLFQTLCGKGKR